MRKGFGDNKMIDAEIYELTRFSNQVTTKELNWPTPKHLHLSNSYSSSEKQSIA